MAIDAQKLLRRRGPELPSDGIPAMQAPAPKKPRAPRQAAPGKTKKTTALRRPAAPVEQEEDRLDGRSLRATGRTVQLNVRVSAEVKARFIELARERDTLMAELFEEAVELLVQRREHND